MTETERNYTIVKVGECINGTRTEGFHELRLVDTAKCARLDITERIFGHDNVNNATTCVEAGPGADESDFDALAARRVKRDDLLASLDETGTGDLISLVQVIPLLGLARLGDALPNVREGDEVVDRSASLHETIAEMRVLVECVIR